MSLIAGACAHGSPGVSTAIQVLAATWPNCDHVPIVVEADSSGGVLAARYELSLSPGFVTLAESLRKTENPTLLDHSQRLPSGAACVPISPSATAVSVQLRSAGPSICGHLARSVHPVFLDVGTLLPDSKIGRSLVEADLLLWFVRPSREELLVLRHRIAECPQPERTGIVLVGSVPYDAEQVEQALELPVIHTLPVDRRSALAANMGGDDRYLRRGQLARSCAALAQTIIDRIGPGELDAVAQTLDSSSCTQGVDPLTDHLDVVNRGDETADSNKVFVTPGPIDEPGLLSATQNSARAIDSPGDDISVWRNQDL